MKWWTLLHCEITIFWSKNKTMLSQEHEIQIIILISFIYRSCKESILLTVIQPYPVSSTIFFLKKFPSNGYCFSLLMLAFPYLHNQEHKWNTVWAVFSKINQMTIYYSRQKWNSILVIEKWIFSNMHEQYFLKTKRLNIVQFFFNCQSYKSVFPLFVSIIILILFNIYLMINTFIILF